MATRELFSNVTSVSINEIQVTPEGVTVYAKFVNADGEETNRPMAGRAWHSLANLAVDLDAFDVEFLYYDDEGTRVNDVVVISK